MKALYKFVQEHGRSGTLTGVFVSEKEYVEKLIQTEIIVDFGEVLGKHSDISGKILPDEITMITDNQEVIKIVEDYGLENGFDPFQERPLTIDYDMLGLDEENEYLVWDIIDHIITNNIIYIK